MKVTNLDSPMARACCYGPCQVVLSTSIVYRQLKSGQKQQLFFGLQSKELLAMSQF